MANTALKYLFYTSSAEQMADMTSQAQPNEIKEETKPVAEKKEEINEKPQIDNKSNLFNVFKTGGMKI